MAGLIILLFLFWLPILFSIWRNILWDTYFWQVKEYRFDRMISHILHQEEDYKQNFTIYTLKLVSIIGLVFYLFASSFNVLLLLMIVTFATYIYETQINIQMIFAKRFIRPKISFRNILILFFALLTSLLPFIIIFGFSINFYSKVSTSDSRYIAQNIGVIREDIEEVSKIADIKELTPVNNTQKEVRVYPAITLILLVSTISALLIDLTTPLIVTFFVFLTEPLAQIKRRRLINLAKAKIKARKDIKVIGITGSFGKTSTKEMLYELLKDEFNTAKTEKNYNSAVGIAIAIIENIKKKTEVFIAEMGAYTIHEVKWATDIAKPDISIVTGVDAQHLTLFGSRENIMKAKFEIIKNAKEDSVAIVNGDNEFSLRMAGLTKKSTIIYFTAHDKQKIVKSTDMFRKGNKKYPYDASIFAHSIEKTKDGIDFVINYKEKDYPVSTNITVEHYISNLLAAISAALILGVDIKDIVKKIKTTKFTLPYLNTLNGLNNTILIDDGYNANSTGFLNALKELKNYKKRAAAKRLVMTKGIMELGWEKKKIYKQIAKTLVECADGLITSDKELIRQVTIRDRDFNIYYVKDDIYDFYKGYMSLTKDGDIVLLEGALNPKLLSEIIDFN